VAAIREKILAADILIFTTPTWMGHTSSVAQRVLERLDAEIAETDDGGRPILLGKVAVLGVVGNEDGAHHITARRFKRSTTSATPSPPRDAPIGTARRWRRPTTTTSTRCRSPLLRYR
jgi:multimeric flavodoxin WrbA